MPASNAASHHRGVARARDPDRDTGEHDQRDRDAGVRVRVAGASARCARPTPNRRPRPRPRGSRSSATSDRDRATRRRPIAIATALASHSTNGTSNGACFASGSVCANAPSNNFAPTGIVHDQRSAARGRARRPTQRDPPRAVRSRRSRPRRAGRSPRTSGTTASARLVECNRAASNAPIAAPPRTCAITIQAERHAGLGSRQRLS